MNEELIKFDTALLAKEKGIVDIGAASNCWVKTLDGDIIHNSERRNCIEHDRCELYIMQPSQSLLQRYLREKHNIHIEILSYHCLKEEKPYGIAIEYKSSITNNWGYAEFDGESDFETYENALEKALIEGLKLI